MTNCGPEICAACAHGEHELPLTGEECFCACHGAGIDSDSVSGNLALIERLARIMHGAPADSLIWTAIQGLKP